MSNLKLGNCNGSSIKLQRGIAIGPPGPPGADGRDGIDGANGMDGKDNYQLWLDNGNIGSFEDYLETLKGEKGDKGDTGDIASLPQRLIDIVNIDENTESGLLILSSNGSISTDQTIYEDKADKGQPDGYSSLDSNGLHLASQRPQNRFNIQTIGDPDPNSIKNDFQFFKVSFPTYNIYYPRYHTGTNYIAGSSSLETIDRNNLSLALSDYIQRSLIGAQNGVCDLDQNAKIPLERLPDITGTPLVWQGNWDALNNIPTLPDDASTITSGWFWNVSVAGTFTDIDFNINDKIASSNGNWVKIEYYESFNESRVRLTPLTGLVDIDGDILTTDTILEAFGKTRLTLENKADLDNGKVPLDQLPDATKLFIQPNLNIPINEGNIVEGTEIDKDLFPNASDAQQNDLLLYENVGTAFNSIHPFYLRGNAWTARSGSFQTINKQQLDLAIAGAVPNDMARLNYSAQTGALYSTQNVSALIPDVIIDKTVTGSDYKAQFENPLLKSALSAYRRVPGYDDPSFERSRNGITPFNSGSSISDATDETGRKLVRVTVTNGSSTTGAIITIPVNARNKRYLSFAEVRVSQSTKIQFFTGGGGGGLAAHKSLLKDYSDTDAPANTWITLCTQNIWNDEPTSFEVRMPLIFPFGTPNGLVMDIRYWDIVNLDAPNNFEAVLDKVQEENIELKRKVERMEEQIEGLLNRSNL